MATHVNIRFKKRDGVYEVRAPSIEPGGRPFTRVTPVAKVAEKVAEQAAKALEKAGYFDVEQGHPSPAASRTRATLTSASSRGDREKPWWKFWA